MEKLAEIWVSWLPDESQPWQDMDFVRKWVKENHQPANGWEFLDTGTQISHRPINLNHTEH